MMHAPSFRGLLTVFTFLSLPLFCVFSLLPPLVRLLIPFFFYFLIIRLKRFRNETKNIFLSVLVFPFRTIRPVLRRSLSAKNICGLFVNHLAMGCRVSYGARGNVK